MTTLATVLLVDDAAILREVVAEHLRALGYDAVEASGGEEALKIAATMEGPIHVLMTDVRMPAMDGPELAERMRAIRPLIRCVFVSGSGPGVADDPRIQKLGGVVLEKPFTQEVLKRVLSEVVAR